MNETTFCCPWREKAWNDQCNDCTRQSSKKWGEYRELAEQLRQQMSNTAKAATVVSKEHAFFAKQVERTMQLEGPSTQGAIERPEDGDEMFQRLRNKYRVIKGREAATEAA